MRLAIYLIWMYIWIYLYIRCTWIVNSFKSYHLNVNERMNQIKVLRDNLFRLSIYVQNLCFWDDSEISIWFGLNMHLSTFAF